MKISEIIIDKYKLRMPPTVFYDLLADVREAEEEQESCEDAISRREVLDVIDRELFKWDVIDEVRKLSPVTPQPKTDWIPISSGKLPEEGERVLATHLGGINPNRQVIEHIYRNGRFVLGWDLDTNVDSPTFGQRYMGEIIAWMPKPGPYMAERSEKNDR